MTIRSKLVVAALLLLTLAVLAINVLHLYTTPVANSWVWWYGDETTLMVQYTNFLQTGKYINPTAPGSMLSHYSGVLFGSCYATAALYGLPALLFGHTIDTGRMITWLFGLLMLAALWDLSRRYRVPTVLRAFGSLLLAATVCFFLTSHSARSDVLIGLSLLILTGALPIALEKYKERDKARLRLQIFIAFLMPGVLLINAHVLIEGFLMLLYMFWAAGGFSRLSSFAMSVAAATVGLLCLVGTQMALLGSPSLLGPFSGASAAIPLFRAIHPRADFTNFNWRIFIAEMWAPGVLWVAIILTAMLIWSRFRYSLRLGAMQSKQKHLLVSSSLVVISSIFLAYYEARYFIYVLPTIVLAFLVTIEYFFSSLPAPSLERTIFVLALGAVVLFAVWNYYEAIAKLGSTGDIITSNNERAITKALKVIHARRAGNLRIFATETCQKVAMDDSCTMVTPVMYLSQEDASLSRSEIWKRANIDYAVVCFPWYRWDWAYADSSINSDVRSSGSVIFETVGDFSDIDRPYDPTNLKILDTLRVYEFPH